MRLWVNEERTVLVREWYDLPGCVMEVALRQDPADIWGAPIMVRPQHAVPASANRGVINDGWWEMLP